METNSRKYDYLLERNQGYMGYTALTTDLSSRKVTFEELHDRINKYAKILYKKGIRKGDVIGVCAHNTIETIYLLYALDIIGAIVVGLNPLENKEKLKWDIEMTKPKMIISVDMAYSSFKEYEKALNFSTILYSPLESCDSKAKKVIYNAMQLTKGNFKLARGLHSLLKINTDNVEVPRATFTENEVTDIMFTGGSSGTHKGVDLAGEGLNAVVEGMDTMYDVEPGMTHLGNIPVGQMVFGRMIMHYTLCKNMQLALTLKAMPEDFIDELVRTQAHAAVGGPPHWVSFIEKKDGVYTRNSKLVKGSLPNLRYATSGGEAQKKGTVDPIDEALKYCGSSARLGDGLGATETWATILANNRERYNKGTLGEPLSNIEIKLIDPETGLEGDEGLLFVSGKSVMLGYHNNPEETSEVISYDESGKKWCNLGDTLKRLPDGQYQYIGRKKRNFVSGVENIYPEQLEDLIATLPEVRELVVTPISDDVLQFIPRYHISLYDENIDFEEFEERMGKLVEKKLSPSWLPGYIHYTTEPLKRMENSKVDVKYYKELDKQDAANNALNDNNLGGKHIQLRPVK